MTVTGQNLLFSLKADGAEVDLETSLEGLVLCVERFVGLRWRVLWLR